MLESLIERMGKALRAFSGKGRLSEQNMADALKQVRTVLLSADVHYKVAREFTERVKQACIGQEVIKSVTPDQMAIKTINDELRVLLGEGNTELVKKKPLRIMLVGLHGMGKTTSCVKLARLLNDKGYNTPLLVGCDVYRPAAIDQLEILTKQENFLFFADRKSKKIPRIAKSGLEFGKQNNADLIIFDTAGRLQIDKFLIDEIKQIKKRVLPDEILLVADSALGQEAVNVAKEFNQALQLTGIILTKLDGDARGGAALSMKEVTGIPIKFIGTGEKTDDFEVFHPERMAERILGMGDIASFVEKAQKSIDHKETEQLEEKIRKADFNLEDFLKQMQRMKKMAPLSSLMQMIPGMSGIKVGNKEEKKLKHTEAIILSMTPYERHNPHLINGSRRKRIAKGAGLQLRDINTLLKQFTQMRKMMTMMKGKKSSKMMKKIGEKIQSPIFLDTPTDKF
jgi:signal recognition particle subunit SRP54